MAELFSLVHSFLVANDQAKSAKALKKGCDSEISAVEGADLLAIYDAHLAENGMSDKKRAKKALPALLSLVNSFLEGKELEKAAKALRKGLETELVEVDGDSLEEIYAKHAKSSAGKKRKADASDSDSDSEEEEAPKKKKKDKKSKKQEAKAEEADSEEEAATKSETPAKAEEEEAEVAEGTPGSKKGGSKTNTPFQRITNDQVYAKVKGGQAEKDRLLDNTFESKSGDGYGSVASDILIQVRGKDFRHEKTKKKRGTYKGGPIDMSSNSIKFCNSDSD
ncbi:SRP40, C-terminal domain-containing protein [Baffinella frigidus]|nr:SRP40, C-terminal domain-containing protein [Cryptophyta sp. CCMP2293]